MRGRGPRRSRRRVAEAQGRPGAAAAVRGVAKSVAEWRERRAMATRHPASPGAARPRHPRHRPEDARRRSTSWRTPRGVDERHRRGTIGREILGAVERGRTASRRIRRRPTSTTSIGRCGPRSPSCRHGSARSPAASGSTPRCSRPAATSSPCCAAIPAPASPRAGGRSCSATTSVVWSPAGWASPSTAPGTCGSSRCPAEGPAAPGCTAFGEVCQVE